MVICERTDRNEGGGLARRTRGRAGHRGPRAVAHDSPTRLLILLMMGLWNRTDEVLRDSTTASDPDMIA